VDQSSDQETGLGECNLRSRNLVPDFGHGCWGSSLGKKTVLPFLYHKGFIRKQFRDNHLKLRVPKMVTLTRTQRVVNRSLGQRTKAPSSIIMYGSIHLWEHPFMAPSSGVGGRTLSHTCMYNIYGRIRLWENSFMAPSSGVGGHTLSHTCLYILYGCVHLWEHPFMAPLSAV
jgi:hypothetical protein